MVMVNVHEAKTQLSRLLEAVERGEKVTIARAGKPVADLVRHEGVRVTFGTLKGEMWLPDDFDDPDPDLIALFEGADTTDDLA